MASARIWLWIAAVTIGVRPLWAEPAQADALPVVEVASGVFVHAGRHEETDATNRGDTANCGFIIGSDAVAVIDTGGGPAIGRALREAVRTHTDRPIRYVINTHMHPDHVFGNAAFLADGPAFVAHRNFQAALTARRDHYLRAFHEATGGLAGEVGFAPITIAVSDRLEIDLGQRTLELVAHPPAHTDNDLTVFDRQTGTLWTGDLVFMEHAPAVDGSVLGWLEVLTALSAVRAVPGHGPASVPWPEASMDLRRYLERIVTGVRAVQKAGGTIQRAVADVGAEERPHWRLFDTYHPRNVTAVFAELEWE